MDHRQIDFVRHGERTRLLHIVPRSHERKGLRAVRHVDAAHDDGVRAVWRIGNNDALDVVALIPLGFAQALAEVAEAERRRLTGKPDWISGQRSAHGFTV